MRLVWEADRGGALLVARDHARPRAPARRHRLGSASSSWTASSSPRGAASRRTASACSWLVAAELGLMAAPDGGRAGSSRCAASCCAARSGTAINERILEKALDARAAPLRGRRRLRQDAERAARGVVPAALARDAGVRDRAERGHARRALRAPPPPLARERPRHRRRVGPRLPRRGAALRRSPSGSGPGAPRRGGGSTTSSGSSRATAT